MNSLARICWVVAPVYLLIGMVLAIGISLDRNFQFVPTHAYFYLLGGITIALYGTFYALQPWAASWAVSRAQVALANLAVVLMFPGIILALEEVTNGVAFAASVCALVSVAMFLYIVIRATSGSKVILK